MTCDLVSRLLVTLWLALMAYHDLRQRELPHWGTTIPLSILGAGISWLWVVREDATALSNSVAISLAFLAIVSSDTWLAAVPGLGALVIAWAAGTLSSQTTTVAWMLALALSRAGIVGAGDAKLVMVLAGLFPDPGLGLSLLLAAGLTGVVVLVMRTGRTAPALVWLAFCDMRRGRWPKPVAQDDALTIALAPALALGGALYLWLSWIR
jgi:Flp pilus assembly protein protease CpaA